MFDLTRLSRTLSLVVAFSFVVLVFLMTASGENVLHAMIVVMLHLALSQFSKVEKTA